MIINVFIFLFFLALASAPALAIWFAESIPVKVRVVLVVISLFIIWFAVIIKFLKKFGMSYSEIGIKLPQKTDLKKNVLLLFSGTLACLLWLRLYAAAFKMLLPAEYDRVASWKNTSYVQFLSEWGKTGEFSGIMALWGGILLLVIIEELAFRGLIFNYLRREYSFKKALIWNSALFALPHLHPYIVPIPFALGLIFTMLYVKSKGLMVPVLTHFAYNLSLSYFGEFIS